VVKKIVAFVISLSVSLVVISLLIAAPAFASSPVVLVSASIEPKDVSPGDNFTLKLNVKNDGNAKAKNLMVTLGVDSASMSDADGTSQGQEAGVSSSQSLLSVLGESNVRYLGSLGSDRRQEVAFRMISDGSARSGTYNLKVKLNYNGARAQDQVVGIKIVRKPDLRINPSSMPSSVDVGKEFKLTAEIVNAGNHTANGVSAELSADGAGIKSPNYFVGTLESADSDVYETGVTFDKPGEKTLRLKVGYVDDFNHARFITKDLKIKVEGNSKPKDKPEDSGGFFSGIAKFFKALFGFGEKSE